MFKEKVTKSEAKKILKENNNHLVNDDIKEFVKLENINKVYDNGFHAVYDFNLGIEKQEFIALVGPSGCGKSTTLRMIAGLEQISNGALYIDKTYSNYLPSKDRDIAMVFQSYALYPQMNVYDNIAFGLKMRKIDKNIIKERVFEAADILDLGELLDRKPKQLSGGQMQRVALGRAIVRKARVFLMDEPLSNLDAKLRVQMRSEIIRIHREVNATTIYVTHDQVEAMTMANRIVVMNKGFVQQVGKPLDIYNNPDNLFVATFIGSPAMNLIKVDLKNGKLYNNDYHFTTKKNFSKTLDSFIKKQIEKIEMLLSMQKIDEATFKKIESAKIYVKQNVVLETPKEMKKKQKKIKNQYAFNEEEARLKLNSYLEEYRKMAEGEGELFVGIRPENFYLAENNVVKNRSNIIDATVDMVELLGNEYIVHFRHFGVDLQAKIIGGNLINIGDNIKLVYDLDKLNVFDKNCGLTIREEEE